VRWLLVGALAEFVLSAKNAKECTHLRPAMDGHAQNAQKGPLRFYGRIFVFFAFSA